MTRLENLARYYWESIFFEVEDSSKRVYADGHDSQFVLLDQLSFSGTFELAPQRKTHLMKLARNSMPRADQGEHHFLVGFPIVAVPREAEVDLVPLLQWRATMSESGLEIDDQEPEVSSQAICHIENCDRPNGEILADDLLGDFLSEPGGGAEWTIEHAITRIRDERPDWKWPEELSITTIVPKLPAIRSIFVDARGLTSYAILNSAMCFPVDPESHSRGLLKELKRLSHDQELIRAAPDTALGVLLEIESPQSLADVGPVLEVCQINEEQRAATFSALKSKLTVVTGPPGTGKSQFVSNLILNCVFHGKSVLLASHNHKAVDVVEDRVNRFAGYDILVRVQDSKSFHSGGVNRHSVSEDLDNTKEVEVLKESQIIRDAISSNLQSMESALQEVRVFAETCEHILPTLSAPLRDRILRGLTPLDLDLSEPEYALQRIRISGKSWISKLWNRKRIERLGNDLVTWFDNNNEEIRLVLPDLLGRQRTPILLEEQAELLSTIKVRLETVRLAEQAVKEVRRFWRTPRANELDLTYMQSELRAERASMRLWANWVRGSTLMREKSPAAWSKCRNYMRTLSMHGAKTNSEDAGEGFRDCLKFLPAWCVTSKSIHRSFPLHPGLFDVLIIDEASQCDQASSLPLLYRAKQVVIIGDSQQLRHISRQSERRDLRLLKKHGLKTDGDRRWLYSKYSLFDSASELESARHKQLKSHFRSHTDIIGFSNEEFYGGSLVLRGANDDMRAQPSGFHPLQICDVRAELKLRHRKPPINLAEARKVIELLRAIREDENFSGSVGVVTPFRDQAAWIRELAATDLTLNAWLADRQITIDTVDMFQGDERDVMIFSIVLGAGVKRGTVRWIEEQRERVNVALTRARDCLVLVGDMDFLRSCESATLRRLTEYTYRVEKPENASVPLGSRVEDMLYEALVEKRLHVHRQYRQGTYLLDFALFREGLRLNIEVDGRDFHTDATGDRLEADFRRDQELSRAGWQILRFWASEIMFNLDNCVAIVLDRISDAPDALQP